jgi:hypothetical protein
MIGGDEMTNLRDQFALAALPVLLKGKIGVKLSEIAEQAYRVADAMVYASVKKMPGTAARPGEGAPLDQLDDSSRPEPLFTVNHRIPLSQFELVQEICPYNRDGTYSCYHQKNPHTCVISHCPLLVEVPE